MTAGSILAHQRLVLPPEPPAGWPDSESGSRMWTALRGHLDGQSFASLGREWGVKPEQVRRTAYAGLAEWRRLGGAA